MSTLMQTSSHLFNSTLIPENYLNLLTDEPGTTPVGMLLSDVTDKSDDVSQI